MDTLLLEGLRVECIIGDLPHERITPQELFLDIELHIKDLTAVMSDQLSDTVDYTKIIAAVRETLVQRKCNMIEFAAQCAAEACFAQDTRIQSLTLTVRKPHAVEGVCAGIRITRERMH